LSGITTVSPWIGLHALKALDELHADEAHHHGGADHAVHVEALEAEHLLDAEPADDLGLEEDDAEEHAPGTVLQVVPPGALHLALVHAHGVELARWRGRPGSLSMGGCVDELFHGIRA
jgi:hypothetical protein